jgi:hypothetical protein
LVRFGSSSFPYILSNAISYPGRACRSGKIYRAAQNSNNADLRSENYPCVPAEVCVVGGEKRDKYRGGHESLDWREWFLIREKLKNL